MAISVGVGVASFVGAGLIYNEYRQDQIAGQQVEKAEEAAAEAQAETQAQISELKTRQDQTTGTEAMRRAKAAQDQRRRQIAGMYGRSDTILTGSGGDGGGLGSTATSGNRNTLLGE